MVTFPATDKQLAFIGRLAAERVQGEVVDAIVASVIDKRTASNAIEALLVLPKAPKPGGVVEAGMYLAGGVVFKVQRAVNGSGNLYAKRLVVEEDVVLGFEYAPGAVTRLTAADKMTMDQAKAFGALYGTCAVCGRTLTDEGSIEAGIGPVCAKRI